LTNYRSGERTNSHSILSSAFIFLSSLCDYACFDFSLSGGGRRSWQCDFSFFVCCGIAIAAGGSHARPERHHGGNPGTTLLLQAT
jgi:hypothetical protein